MKQHRIVLDTNVLISAVLFGGPPRQVLELVISGAVDCTLSIPILDEIRHVLYRPKFGFSPEQSFQLLEELHAVCDVINPTIRLNAVTSDPDDNMVLECALESGASFIVSGDRHLLDLVEFRGIRIVTPSEYLKQIAEKTGLPTKAPNVRGQARR